MDASPPEYSCIFRCSSCSDEFSTPDRLRLHLREAHGTALPARELLEGKGETRRGPNSPHARAEEEKKAAPARHHSLDHSVGDSLPDSPLGGIATAAASFAHRSEGRAELRFTNRDSIPEILTVGHEYFVDFMITNHDTHQRYTCAAYLIEDESVRQSILMDDDLDDGQSIGHRIAFVPTRPGTELRVFITLANTPEAIQLRATT